MIQPESVVLASAQPFSDDSDENRTRDRRGRWILVLGGETNVCCENNDGIGRFSL